MEDQPLACTLTADARDHRLAWIRELNAVALLDHRRDGARIELCYHPSAAPRVRELARRERDCCPFLGVRASGKLSAADYRDVLAPRVEALIEQFTTLKVLFAMDETFDGWTLGAAWANTVFDIAHRRHFARIAMVGAPRWEEWCVTVPAAVLMSGELRTFRRDHLDQAWAWLFAA